MNLKVNSDTVLETYGKDDANGTRKDLIQLANRIGFENAKDLHLPQFRVELRNLKHMLIGDNETPEPPEPFFLKIMQNKKTINNWPRISKMGTTKKDPEVAIAGRQEDVRTARERLLNSLTTRCNRVTIKMEVSHLNHQHIIGRKGHRIRRITEETGCSVYFPESNLSCATRKSNEVEISGDIESIEQTRSRIRNLTPLIFNFEVPNAYNSVIPNIHTPYVKNIEQQYKVKIWFQIESKHHRTLVMVQGLEWETRQVKQATCLLMEFMCGDLSNQIPIEMYMEVSSQHLVVLAGKNHANIKSIVEATQTQIVFPDAQDPNAPSFKKNKVVISGNIDNVYLAKQQLVGSLPLVVIFDVPNGWKHLLSTKKLQKIQADLDVTINIIGQENTKCVIIGIERYASNIYEARNRVLGIDEPSVVADIPLSYFIPIIEATSEVIPAMNVQPSSDLISSTMRQPFYHAAPSVGMVQQSRLQYSKDLLNSRTTSGYTLWGGSSTVSLKRSENENRSSIGSTCTTSSSIEGSNNILPFFYQTITFKHFTVSELSSVLFDRSNSSLNYYQSKRNVYQQSLISLNSDPKNVCGIRKMQNKHEGGYRVPTSTWSSYNIRYSSQRALQSSDQEKNKWNQEKKDPASSNILESTPVSLINKIASTVLTDLPSPLNYLGLETYVGLFTSQEIDLTIFPSLNKHDLIQLGITGFSAHRKMMSIISEMNKRPRSLSAVPGAETRRSSSNNNISQLGMQANIGYEINKKCDNKTPKENETQPTFIYILRHFSMLSNKLRMKEHAL